MQGPIPFVTGVGGPQGFAEDCVRRWVGSLKLGTRGCSRSQQPHTAPDRKGPRESSFGDTSDLWPGLCSGRHTRWLTHSPPDRCRAKRGPGAPRRPSALQGQGSATLSSTARRGKLGTNKSYARRLATVQACHPRPPSPTSSLDCQPSGLLTQTLRTQDPCAVISATKNGFLGGSAYRQSPGCLPVNSKSTPSAWPGLSGAVPGPSHFPICRGSSLTARHLLKTPQC